MNSRRLAVLGAGGHAKVVVASAQASGYRVVAVLDDQESSWGGEILGCTVSGPIEAVDPSKLDGCVLAIGANQVRRTLASKLDLPWVSVVHPAADIHASVSIGEGTVVFAGAIVQPDSVLGSHVILNTGATVDHDCRIGDFTHVGPGVNLAGSVTIGSDCLMGVGSAVTPSVSVGNGAVIGANAAVVHDVPPGVTAVGVPARPLS